MSHWNEAAVTNAGTEMLNEMMAGRKLTLTAAYGGTGLVEAGELEQQTGLLNQQQKLSIIDERTDETGKTITVQVVNADAEYELNQVGVFASLDAGKETETPEELLFIMQDRAGVTIPDTNDQTFMLELFCVLKIVNNGRFEVSIDKTGIVSIEYLERKLAEINASMAEKTSINGEEAPGPETDGQPGQHYFDSETGREYICTKVTEDGGYVWEETGHILVDDADGETRFKIGVENGKIYIQAAENTAEDAGEE